MSHFSYTRSSVLAFAASKTFRFTAGIKAALAVTLCTFTTASTAPGGPQENALARRDQTEAYVKKAAEAATQATLSGIDTLAEWQESRPELRRRYLYMLGLDPMPPRTPLHAEITGHVESEGYRIEKIVFQSSPGLYVTGNLYLPSDKNPLPTILYVCGHSPHPRGAKFHYQDRAQWFVENGYACFILDTLEFGEVAGIHHGLHNLNMWRWLSKGYTPAGVEVWNAIRALDYLESRPEIDSSRIGITGISGGGAVSWYTAAADDRIAAAVPVCGTFSFASQARHGLADGQCDCIYFHNTYRADLALAGALIAPRPLLICSGIRDTIFPPDGYHHVYHATKKIYDLYAENPAAEPSRIAEVDDDVPHQDSPKLRRAARQWFHRWLLRDSSVLPLEPNPEESRHSAEELACLDSIPWDAANFSIHDHFVASRRPDPPSSLDVWKQRRVELLHELEDKTFGWLPREHVPEATEPNGGHGGWLDRYGTYEDVQIASENEVSVRLQLVLANDRTPSRPLLLYIKRPTDQLSFVDVDELLPVLGHADVAMLNPRLTETPLDPQEWANLERTAVWSGRTIAAMQVQDILQALKWLLDARLKDAAPNQIALFAKDSMSVPALYASALEPRVTQLILRGLPTTHNDEKAPPLLNVLRFTDLPEIAALFAPRQLSFLHPISPEFDVTRQVYEFHGAPKAFATLPSLAQALLHQAETP